MKVVVMLMVVVLVVVVVVVAVVMVVVLVVDISTGDLINFGILRSHGSFLIVFRGLPISRPQPP